MLSDSFYVSSGQEASVSEFSCPFMPQYMPHPLDNKYTENPEDVYTPRNSRVWRVAIPVIADINQAQACQLVDSDQALSAHQNAQWIIVGFVETVIFDTDIGLGIQHAPGITYSANGKTPYTCDYEQGYAIKAKSGSQMVDGVLEDVWVDLRGGRKPWQFTPEYSPTNPNTPPTACNMVRARISCETQLLASRDFGRNAKRKVRVISK